MCAALPDDDGIHGTIKESRNFTFAIPQLWTTTKRTSATESEVSESIRFQLIVVLVLALGLEPIQADLGCCEQRSACVDWPYKDWIAWRWFGATSVH